MLLFGQLDRNSTKQAIQKTLKSAARTVFFVEFRANCHNNQRTITIVFYKNFGSKIAKYYSMAKPSGAAFKTR